MSNFADIRALIIDLDGTMLDTGPDFLIAINRMRAELSLPGLDIKTITHFVGKGSANLVQRVLSVDFEPAKVEQHFEAAMASYEKHYLAINGDYSTLYPEVMEGLHAFKAQGLKLACVTNKPMNFTTPLLAKKGLSGFFDLVYGGDSFARKKPDPMPMLEACKGLGLEPHQVLAIGDSSNDAAAARAAGCPVVIVPYGYNHGEAVQTIESDGIVETLLAVAQILVSKNIN
ncbi:phosphoglycolate phosphatase [Undibacterium sp. LX40W]|uniref:Phosphoglycolate phosphatase n=1 Tax=Undibacterium nitidum TaxID=2762298 RepID=A0A923KMA2_9BURK|nr:MULTISPECIES: phosphoglycolate phosphatase [Undibacterium]MBC3882690.1 phosphoglycolate phosphatase [Undibacterium nitidum]MBC3893127.1 phosphoglycolate phosphatase [Undibacterium sp. LX40W]